MSKELVNTLKHSFLYSLGNLGVKLIGFFLLPIYAQYLSISEYGILTLMEITVSILTPLLALNINTSLTRFLPEAKTDTERGKLLFNTLLFVLIAGVGFNILLQPFAPQISQLVFGSKKFGLYFRLVFINVFLQNLTFTFRNYFNAIQKPIKFSGLNIFRLLIVLVLTYVFLRYYKLGVAGVLLAQTFSYIFSIVLFSWDYLRQIRILFDKQLLISLISFSWPIAFSGIANQILGFGDRYVLKFLLGATAVGIYSLAAKFANLIELAVVNSLRLSYEPFAFRNYEKPWFYDHHKRATTTYFLFTLIAGLLLTYLAKDVLILLTYKNPDYWQAAPYIAPLVVAKSLLILRNMFSISLLLPKHTKPIGIIILLSALANIGLNILLVPWFKIYGTIISTILILVLMDVAFYIYGQRVIRFQYDFKRIFGSLALTVVFIYLGQLPNLGSMVLNIILRMIIFVLYLVTLYLTRIIKREQLLFVKNFVKGMFQNRGL